MELNQYVEVTSIPLDTLNLLSKSTLESKRKKIVNKENVTFRPTLHIQNGGRCSVSMHLVEMTEFGWSSQLQEKRRRKEVVVEG